MKNFMKFLITCLTAVFVSCPQIPEVEVSPAQEYKITYTVSGTGKDAVTVNGPATAKSGDTVTFTIDGIGFDKRLVSVEYYYIFNSDCDYNEETGEYSFTMPGLDTPVTIIVEQLTDVSKDGAISWRGTQPSQIVPGNEGVQELTFNVDASWTTSYTVELTSTDENVIPPSALIHKALKESDSNAITGITISIDLSQIKPGKTYLIVNFQSGNTSAKGEIIKLIEVTGTLNETILNATLEVDMSAFNGDTSDKYIQFVDQNYQNGSKVEEPRTIYFADQTGTEDVFALDLQFVEGHAYKVSVGKVKSGDSYVIDDSISGGGSTTDDDYNGIIDSILRIKTDGSTIEINVKNEVVPLG